jgi:hypothetical protein
MKTRKNLRKPIQGWFPREPKLSGKYLQNSPIEAKAKMDTTKRMSVSLLSVIGLLLLIFPIEFYFLNPSGWHLALASNVSFWVISAVLITLAIVIQKKKTTEKQLIPELKT